MKLGQWIANIFRPRRVRVEVELADVQAQIKTLKEECSSLRAEIKIAARDALKSGSGRRTRHVWRKRDELNVSKTILRDLMEEEKRLRAQLDRAA